MAARTLSTATSLRVTVAYAVVLVAVSETLTALGPHARDVVVSDMSTNLHNLAHGHVAALVGSAFSAMAVQSASGCRVCCACSLWAN